MRFEKTPSAKRKVRLFTAVVFAATSALMTPLMLGQGIGAAVAVGLLIGATAAVEVGWFGGRAFFGMDGDE